MHSVWSRLLKRVSCVVFYHPTPKCSLSAHAPTIRVLSAATQGASLFLGRGRVLCPRVRALSAPLCEGGCKGKEALSSFGQTSWPQKAKIKVSALFVLLFGGKKKKLSLYYHKLCNRIWQKLKYLEERESFLRPGKNSWLEVYFTLSIWWQG